MLQQGFELLAGKLLVLPRGSLALGYILMSWRHTSVVFIPKPGKSLSQAKSLRPISLMSFVIKTLEKIIARHIRDGVLVEKPLHHHQYAYCAGMSTGTALFQVVSRLEKSLRNKENALGAFLDIEGAFDNTSFNAITTAARERGLEETCCRWIRSMLEGRLVHTSLMGSNLTAQVVGGCPQGGVLSPLLWNLVVDRLLIVTNDLGFRTLGYADDIVIMVQGKFEHTVRELMQSALDVVVNWVVKEGLNISPHKTTILSFTNRRKVGDLRPITLLGKELTMLGEVKYLGVILDSRLNWNQHLLKLIRKAVITFAVVRGMYGKRWGLRPSMMHWLYTRVIRPIFFAALVWWPKVKQKCTKNQLDRIQRMACLAIPGAMKSTLTAAMEVLLNLTPLGLLIMAEARMALYRLHILEQSSVPRTVTGLLDIGGMWVTLY
jgi:hypothetical protein